MIHVLCSLLHRQSLTPIYNDTYTIGDYIKEQKSKCYFSINFTTSGAQQEEVKNDDKFKVQ